MSNGFVVSARKFRPDSFESLLGQDAVRETLRRAILQQKTAHAYLFCGPRGVGKTSAARIFAKAINCLTPHSDGEACGVCESCKAFEEQRSLNIFELDAASNNSTADIRRLIDEVSIPPQIGKYRIYIIDEVHMLSTAAFNAFLKTLEEPPSYVVFILATTEKHKILPTILSRCQVYDFRPISAEVIAQQLAHIAEVEGINAEPKALQLIAQKADGGMRDALSVFDRIVSFTAGDVRYERTLESLNILDEEYYVRLVNHIIRGEQAEVLLLLDELLEKGFDTRIIINGLTEFMRMLLIAYDALTLPLLRLSKEQASEYNKLAQTAGKGFLYRSIMQLMGYGKEYRNSNSKRLLAEMTLLSLNPTGYDGAPQSAPPVERSTPPPSSTQENRQQVAPLQPSQVRQSIVHNGTTVTLTNELPKTPPPPSASFQKGNTSQKASSTVAQPVAPQPIAAPQTVIAPPMRTTQKEEEQHHSTQNETTLAPAKENILSEDRLIAEWTTFANRYITQDPFLKNTMTTSLPRKKEDGNWSVRVFNNLQLQALEKIMPRVLHHLRTLFDEQSLQINVEIIDEQELRAYTETADDWFRALLEKNKELQKLIKKLDLTVAH